MKKLLIIIAALVISNSCQKDDYLEFYDLKYECTKSMKFSCEGITSDQYFKGIINGKEFCVSHGNKYKDLTGFYTGGTTTSPFEFDPSEFGRVGCSMKEMRDDREMRDALRVKDLQAVTVSHSAEAIERALSG